MSFPNFNHEGERIERMQKQVAELRRKEPTRIITGLRFPAIWPKLTACNWKYESISNISPPNW